jgi:hypothetical protein
VPCVVNQTEIVLRDVGFVTFQNSGGDLSMMEAAGISETSVNFYQTTRRYNREDCHLQEHEVVFVRTRKRYDG